MPIPYQAEIRGIPGGEFIISALQRLFEGLQAQPFRIGNRRIHVGAGNPDASVTTGRLNPTIGEIGDLYLRTDLADFDANDTTTRPHSLYLKQQNRAPDRGWFLVTTVGPSGMTSGRVAYSDGGSVLQGDSDLSFDGTTLNATQIATNQITFPATQAASSDANALDDYEEGTWTPVLGGTTSESGQTYSAQQGTYVKIGQFVFCRGRVTLTALGTITGSAVIKGLPFTVNAMTGGGSVGLSNGLTTAIVSMAGFTVSSTAYMQLGMRTAAATNLSAMAQADFSNTSDITFDIAYRTTA